MKILHLMNHVLDYMEILIHVLGNIINVYQYLNAVRLMILCNVEIQD